MHRMIAFVVASASLSAAGQQVFLIPPYSGDTLVFQQGRAGYTGAFDLTMSAAGTTLGATVDGNTSLPGSGLPGSPNFLDGPPNSSSRADYLIRFSNIVGPGPGQIPAGSVVIESSMTLYQTSDEVSAASATSGVYNVYRLRQPFDAASTIGGDFGGSIPGAESVDGEVDLRVGSFDPANANGGFGNVDADVTLAVQSWADGAPAHGLAVVSDFTSNGWSIHTTGSSQTFPIFNESWRPAISATVAQDPGVLQGVLGGTVTDIEITSDPAFDGLDGATTQTILIDGPGPMSDDAAYLIKFEELIGDDGVPPGTQILRAFLTLHTANASSGSGSPGPFVVRPLLVPFTKQSRYADFAGTLDQLVAAGEVAPPSIFGETTFNEIGVSETVQMDVTAILQAWLAGEPNHGFYIGSMGTDNGWFVHPTGVSDPALRPSLRVIADIDPADVDDDGDADSDDALLVVEAIDAAGDLGSYDINKLARFDFETGDRALTMFDLIEYLRRYDDAP